jgi:hypothetical protein
MIIIMIVITSYSEIGHLSKILRIYVGVTNLRPRVTMQYPRSNVDQTRYIDVTEGTGTPYKFKFNFNYWVDQLTSWLRKIDVKITSTMIFTRYLVGALAASLVPAGAFGRSVFSFFGDTQRPLLKSGCDDGTGIVDPDGHCNGTGVVDDPIPQDREGFQFENPSTHCKYVSQMHIWDSFKTLEKDMNKLFTLIHKDVKFTVVGHHPIAGRYHDLLHFYVNALRRVSVMFFDHADQFEIHPQGIFGGCNAEWSVQEIQFKGVMNSGERISSELHLSYS